MRIQFLGGGLANQILQYTFIRFAERQCPEEKWFLDDSFFFVIHQHNGYELEKIFGIQANLLSRYFDADVWQEILLQKRSGRGIPQIFSDMGLPFVMVRATTDCEPFTGKIITFNRFQFHPEIVRLPYQNIYYHHYGKTEFFLAYKEENLKELVFPPLTDKKNLIYAEQIENSFSVGVHIRRGDFTLLGWQVPCHLYKDACKTVLERFSDVHFFVFSDDLQWCRIHAEELGFCLSKQITYVEGNTSGKNYMDMQLLSLCHGMIRPAQSTFSMVAAWLAKNLAFEITLGKEF